MAGRGLARLSKRLRHSSICGVWPRPLKQGLASNAFIFRQRPSLCMSTSCLSMAVFHFFPLFILRYILFSKSTFSPQIMNILMKYYTICLYRFVCFLFALICKAFVFCSLCIKESQAMLFVI